ncbi:MAG: Tn7 transposase TnsA N-terminal domain-containing protein [Ferrovibrio sp.]|uniref:Tn7 transposase TnsA N-terminal domain-containing protein n=1 Tax=Ferrovibrio sp. TaxID=1917215 RepID=UPI00391A9CBA
MMLCEVDSSVTAFIEQPLTLRYRVAGSRARIHKPDFMVQRGAAIELIETKWEGDAASPENEARWPVIGAAVSALGWSFEVVSERHINRQPRLDNVIALHCARHTPMPNPEMELQLANLVRQGAVCSIDQAIKAIPTLSLRQILAMTFMGRIRLLLDEEISGSSRILSA